MTDILDRAIENWGSRTQVDKAIEEMGELIRAIIKDRYKPATPELRDNLLEEIADVEIMMSQLRRIFDTHDQIDLIKRQKLIRLGYILDHGGEF